MLWVGVVYNAVSGLSGCFLLRLLLNTTLPATAMPASNIVGTARRLMNYVARTLL